VRCMAHALHAYDLAFDPSPRDPSPAVVLEVLFCGPGGERCSTIGVGTTVDEALAWARESAPAGTPWLASGWSDVYGD
jgi:hypothetical protein